VSTRVSLRKTLREVTIFQSLPPRELDVVAAYLTRREYAEGERLWRAGAHHDFMGIIQKGEVVVEYRTSGATRRSTRLKAGSFFYPGIGKESRGTYASACAASQAMLYVLPLEHLSDLRSKCPTLDYVLSCVSPARDSGTTWVRVWSVAVAILIALFVWRDVTSALSGLLYLAADREVSSLDQGKAMLLLDYAVKLDNQAAYAYNGQGYFWDQMGEKQLAANAFAKALSIDGANGSLFNNLAVTYFEAGFRDDALALQQEAAAADPNVAIIKYNLGLMLIELEDYQGAIRALKEATRINPNGALPYLHLSFVYVKSGDCAEAEHTARIATRLDPTQQSAYLGLAIALHEQHKCQEALACIARALEVNPENVSARFYQALILRDVGDYDQALLTLQQILDLSSDPEERSRVAVEVETILRLQQDLLSDTP
jgi:tetratricopeptide (TPR) repeat protein